MAMPQRTPGYVVFSKFFQYIFPQNYAQIIVGVQAIMGLFAVHVFLKGMSRLLKLNFFLKGILLILLVFPFFPPLFIANNICSEGLTYPLYLLFLTFGFEFLYNEKRYTLLLLSTVYILLVLTRGQFIVTTLIFAFVYIFKYRTNILTKRHLTRFLLMALLPILVIFADKTYHQLKDDVFKSTPYTFVSMSGAAFYVSHESDVQYVKNKDYKKLFQLCHNTLEEKKLLMTSKQRNGFDDYYRHFHNNVPQICNQTVHDSIRKIYFQAFLEHSDDTDAASVYSLYQSEKATKSIFFTLVKHNLEAWLRLYYSNIVHGFKSVFILILVIVVFLFSGFKMILRSNIEYEILFLLSALTLSNAIIVSLASHSIMRYLFYNYVSIFLMVIIIFKILSNAKRD